eukprot:6872616-Alexandrium_andersonii.AAC.1
MAAMTEMESLVERRETTEQSRSSARRRAKGTLCHEGGRTAGASRLAAPGRLGIGAKPKASRASPTQHAA